MPDFVEIKDRNLPELQVYAITSEVQLLRYFEPEPGLFIAETARVIARALDAGYEPLSMLVEKRQLENIRRKRMGRAKTANTAEAAEAQVSGDQAVERAERPGKGQPGKGLPGKEQPGGDLPGQSESQQTGEDLSDIIERCGDIPIYVADLVVLTQITGFALTRGVLCAMRRHPLPDAETVCRHASRIAVLEEIMNPTNVGAVFRSAAALGFDGVLLTAGCCDPLYRRAVRVSMGTVFQIPWAYLENAGRPELEEGTGQPGPKEVVRRPGLEEGSEQQKENLGEKAQEKSAGWSESEKRLKQKKEDVGREAQEKDSAMQKPEKQNSGPFSSYVDRLKSMGFATAAMALTDDSVGIDDPDLMAEERLAVILGTEGEGLRDSTIRACDYTVKIPMAHGVDSLNVAAASAVAFWQLRKEK